VTALCERISAEMGALYSCSEHDGYVRVTTPFLYPDGDVIDLFIKSENDTGTLTDLGETVRWLRGQTLSPRRSPKQRQMIDAVCRTQGVEFFRGMLMTRVDARENLAAAVARLAEASIRVADLWFTLRTRSLESVTDEVADFLFEREIPFERGERLPGRSGRAWNVDFHTRTSERSAFVNVLSTGSRAGAKTVAEHVLAAWYDLSHFQVQTPGLRFVSLFDDTMDVWTSEDFKLLEPLSDLAMWSRPDEFERLLRPAAA
jgi:hypothetical protein